ncbi:hypothetical protein ABKN59_000924 [Abortiporus biennis]
MLWMVRSSSSRVSVDSVGLPNEPCSNGRNEECWSSGFQYIKVHHTCAYHHLQTLPIDISTDNPTTVTMSGPATKQETTDALERLKLRLASENKDKLPKPSYAAVVAAAKDLAQRLTQRNVSYYFCGGFACVYLCQAGRTTADIDVVAKDNTNYGSLLDIVGAMTNVIVDRVLSESPLYYHKPSQEFVEMDCLPAGWAGNFPKFTDKGFGLEQKDSLEFLSSAQLLRLKFKSWGHPVRRENAEKLNGDKMDILGLRKYIRFTLKTKVDKSIWEDAEKKALNEWIKQYNDANDWKEIGL